MKKIKNKLLILITTLSSTPTIVFAACSPDCNDLAPAVRLVKGGLVPLFQLVIPIGLIVYGMIDFAKASTAGKEEDMKKSESMFVKRCIYAVGAFLVITIVTLVMNLFTYTGADQEVEGTNEWWICWNSVDECTN